MLLRCSLVQDLAGDADMGHVVDGWVHEWRSEMLGTIGRKVHSIFMLSFLEELPARLVTSVHSAFDKEELDMSEARAQLQQQRDHLAHEQSRVSSMLTTFQRVAHAYAT